jgi:hypothetical protein
MQIKCQINREMNVQVQRRAVSRVHAAAAQDGEMAEAQITGADKDQSVETGKTLHRHGT